jgi:hypothetical protein
MLCFNMDNSQLVIVVRFRIQILCLLRFTVVKFLLHTNSTPLKQLSPFIRLPSTNSEQDQYEEKSSTEPLGSMHMSVAETLTPTLSPNDGEDDEIEELIDLDEANVISLPNWDRTGTSRHSGLHNALNHFLRPEVPLSSDNSDSWVTQQDQTLE